MSPHAKDPSIKSEKTKNKSRTKEFTFIDLFAGAGGLSEGFIRNGFKPVAHVEMNKEACDTITTRMAYHFLNNSGKLDIYQSYLKGEISRDILWSKIPVAERNSVINQEITEETIAGIFDRIDILPGSKKVDVIIGGPPCQAYSLVGRSRDPNGMKGDKRNYLFRFYGEFLKRYKPRYFVFENVLGLLSAGSKSYLNEMLELYKKIGYTTSFSTLSSEHFDVLQKRKRVIIIGHLGSEKFDFDKFNKTENNWEIKKDLFFDLPKLKPGDAPLYLPYKRKAKDYLIKSRIRTDIDFVTQHICRHHNARDLEIYSIAIDKLIIEKTRLKYSDLPERLQTHKNITSFLDRFKVVDPIGHSHTMVAHISKDGHHYIYPDAKQVRSISVREAARIQSFPDDYFFEGGRTAAFKQIGNAVPPLMAEKIANKLKKQFLNEY